jgi:hypothetical protein
VDFTRAAEWYRRAAEQGLPSAQFNVGYGYAYGIGVEKDEAEAARWFERAATAGHGMAQESLGLAYLVGRGVEKDETRALMWLELAAESGQKDSAGALVDLRKVLDESKQAEARQLAQAWRESRAAAQAQAVASPAGAEPPMQE